MMKFDAKPCFVREGIALRGTRHPSASGRRAVKVVGSSSTKDRSARSPTTRVRSTRGQRVEVAAGSRNSSRQGPLSEQFVIFA